jgi:hypothetical protein
MKVSLPALGIARVERRFDFEQTPRAHASKNRARAGTIHKALRWPVLEDAGAMSASKRTSIWGNRYDGCVVALAVDVWLGAPLRACSDNGIAAFGERVRE